MIFEKINDYNFEQIIYCNDPDTGLKAIIVLDDSTFGPAAGGTRLMAYPDEEAALTDALRLAQGMTRKCALAQAGVGGAKAVIICDPKNKTEAMLRSYGRFVEKLNGTFLTGNDVNISFSDAQIIAEETQYALGASNKLGTSSPVTAHGVFVGMRACVKALYQQETMEGLTVAIQGLGAVGFALAQELHNAGAKLIVSDINQEVLKKTVECFGATIVQGDEIYSAEADIFAPCALGAILNPNTIPKLKCKLVCGAANNQLLSSKDGDDLYAKGILYAPDYVVNAGGAIYVRVERTNPEATPEDLIVAAELIEETMAEIIAISNETKVPLHHVADRLADERVSQEKQRLAALK